MLLDYCNIIVISYNVIIIITYVEINYFNGWLKVIGT